MDYPNGLPSWTTSKRSQPTNPTILDRTTESSVIPQRNHNLDTLPKNPPQLSSADNVLELHFIDKDGLATVEGDLMTETRETETCMLEDQIGLLATAAEGESQEHINHLEDESQECGTESQIPQDEFKTNSSYKGSQSINGQKMLDGITESPVISPRDYNLDLLCERHDGSCDERLAVVHLQSNDGDHRVSETNKVDYGSNMSCGNSENCGSGMAVLPISAACDDLQRQPRDKWMRFGARPKTRPVKRTPREPSLVESLTYGLPDAVRIPVDSPEIGINEEFIVRHSRDRSLLESQHPFSIENELSRDSSLPGASLYMGSMVNNIEADRMKPGTVDDEVASRPDQHNRLSLPLLMRQEERGYAVGGSTFEESLDGTTGPDCTLNSDHLPSTSMGNMAHVAAGNFDLLCPYSPGRSNGALNGVLSEAESTAAYPYAPGNASSTCNLVNPAVDHVAVLSEPYRAESANSRDSMSDRNAVTDCNGINSALLALAQRVQKVCVVSGEQQIEGEQQREARLRAWNSNRRFQDQTEDFIIESLDSTLNSARVQVTREAVIRALTEKIRRGPSSCSRPGEHSCVCLENDGSQTCGVYGTIAPETCRPEPAHGTCCKCLEDVFSGSVILPCSHHVHTECLVGMIQNGELNCPICGRAFL